jgi:DNA polymerase III epsilon subunit-like protein
VDNLKKSLFNIYVDVETTNFDPIRGDITSIGVVVTDNSFSVLDQFYSTVKPELNKFTSDEALTVSGFTRAALMLHKPRREACIDIMKFLKPFLSEHPQLMVSHTVNGFDWRFVDWMFRKEDLNWNIYKVLRHDYQLSTIKLARELGHSNNKLGEWATRLNLSFNHHNALDDALMCYNIHKHLEEKK